MTAAPARVSVGESTNRARTRRKHEHDDRTAQAAREELSGFRGELIGPEDAGYEGARSVYNAMIDKRPGLIARVRTPTTSPR